MKFRERFTRIVEEREAMMLIELKKPSRNLEDKKKEVDKREEKMRILTKYFE
jgi:Cdc6-like AAA superfamily ATPase